MLPRWIVLNYRSGAPLDKELSQPVAVIGCVGSTHCRRWQSAKQAQGGAHIAELAWSYLKRDESPTAVDRRMDFRRAAAA